MSPQQREEFESVVLGNDEEAAMLAQENYVSRIQANRAMIRGKRITLGDVASYALPRLALAAGAGLLFFWGYTYIQAHAFEIAEDGFKAWPVLPLWGGAVILGKLAAKDILERL